MNLNQKSSKSDNNTILISIVIPAYKAEKFVAQSLLKVRSVLENVGFRYEIICVVDGQEMDKTYEKALAIKKKFPTEVKVVGYLTNLGKGHAVRYGMARAKGDIIGFVDVADINPNGIRLLLEHFEWYRADIIIGSKRHPASKVIYPWQRRVISVGYQILVRILFGLNVKDTQVGIKFFKREVLEKVLPRVLVKKFAFDIEMLAVAYSLGFIRIFEAPVELKMKFGVISTITNKSFIKTVFWTFWDTLAVFYRLKIRNYYDYKNRKNWVTPEYLTLNKN